MARVAIYLMWTIAADGGPNTGHTVSGDTLACAAVAKVQKIIGIDAASDVFEQRR